MRPATAGTATRCRPIPRFSIDDMCERYGRDESRRFFDAQMAAIAAGARVHAHSAVIDWRVDGGKHRLKSRDGEVIAGSVVIATNGYSAENMPPWIGGRLLPAMSNIMVTRPLSDAEWSAQGWTGARMAFDTPILLHYFWHGLICMTARRVPYIGPVSDLPNVFAALAYHGNGVAFSGWAGEAVADCVAGADGAEDRLPAVVRDPIRRFPLPALRLFYLRLAYARFAIIDRFL